MSSAVLPPIPPALESHRVAFTGHSARLMLTGESINVLPELMVEGTLDNLLQNGVSLVVDPACLGRYRFGDWRICLAPDGIESALLLRSVNMEAIGYLPDGTVLDPLDCLEDVKNGIIRGHADRASEDPLAGLKIIALLGETGGILDEATRESLPDWMENVLAADRTTIRYWLTRLLVSRDPKVALALLHETKGLITCSLRCPRLLVFTERVNIIIRMSGHILSRSFVRLCRVH